MHDATPEPARSDSDGSPPAAAAEAGFPCPSCGADLAFDAEAGALACRHCGHRRAVATDAPSPAERDYRAAAAAGAAAHPAVSAREARCASCGAAIGFEPGIEAQPCPFCAGPLTLAPDPRRRFAPDGVLPFAVSERAARQALADWLDGLWFAPGDLGAYARAGRRLSGVYLPFWTFDADAEADYAGARGDAYTVYETRTRFVDGEAVRKRTPVRKMRWTPVAGRVRKRFDDVLAAASRTLPERFADRLGGLNGGWDLAALAPFQPDYLAGYRAEGYGVDLEEGFAEAQATMAATLRRAARFDIGGDAQTIHRLEARYRDVTFKLALLPIWIAAYRYRGRTYRFVVNGRTGAVVGDRPYAWWKLALAGIGGALAAALLIFALVALDAA